MDTPLASPFVRRFLRIMAGTWPELAVLTLACAVAELVVMALVSRGTAQVALGEDMTRSILMFWSMVAILAMSRYAVLRQAGLGTARLVEEFRLSLFTRLANCELSDLERLGRSEVQLTLGRDIATLSQPSNFIFSTVTTALNLVMILLYLLFLEPVAGVAIAALQVTLFMWFYQRRKKVLAALQARARAESPLFSALNSVILGFVELRLHAGRRRALVDTHLGTLSSRARLGQEAVSMIQTENFTSVDVFHYLTIGLPVFVLPTLHLLTGDQVSQVTAMVIFTMGSVPEIIINLTVLSQFDVATQRLEALEAQLTRPYSVQEGPSTHMLQQVQQLECLELEQLGYTYFDALKQSAFSVGPISLTLQRGEMLFIVGGNGSGKTTLLRTLIGLYLPTAGRVRLNGVEITAENLDTYRGFFSAVFTDFHLFDQLYGLDHVPPEAVQAQLERLSLAGKTRFENRAFTTQSLSTGQRKRLALLTTLLEDRQILVLDEVAADQDPEFRRFYYTVLLPELKAAGKTLLVVSHDDHYFHVADRVLRMDFGQMRLLDVPKPPMS